MSQQARGTRAGDSRDMQQGLMRLTCRECWERPTLGKIDPGEYSPTPRARNRPYRDACPRGRYPENVPGNNQLQGYLYVELFTP